jgi:hypothetical protein
MFVAALLRLAGCATAPAPPEVVPEPHQAGEAAIGIDLVLQAPAGGLRVPAEVVYFARMDAAGGTYGAPLLASSYSKDGRVYLLNVPPGTYVAVGAHISRGDRILLILRTTYFLPDLVARTKTQARADELAYMGSYVVDVSTPFFTNPDETTRRNLDLIGEQTPKDGSMMPPVRHHYYGTELEARSDETARNLFAGKARDDLKESSWAERLR